MFGAFGCDAEERNHLPQFAVDRAAAHTGRTFSGKDVIVIEYTPRGIECGKPIGATTVGVATGHFTVDENAEHKPDMVLETLEEFRIP
ncbi:MAG: HAD hydrolase-like protein [Bacteroidetes bacterium]|nr:HAD hydrolase-like protein [Bacteroidota bacterium]